MTETLFTAPRNLPVFRALLLEKLGWSEPKGDLSLIPQWNGFLQSMGADASLADYFRMADLAGGYFYNFHNPAPAELKLQNETSVVPTVPSDWDDRLLLSRGYLAVPAYIESILNIEGGLEETLRRTISSRRYLDLQRITRKAETYASVEFFRKDALLANPEIVETAGAVHGANALKYNHPFNMYDRESLARLLNSPLGENLVIGIVQSRSANEPVQVILALVDEARGQMHYLAQGIQHDKIPASINLYSASYLWLYRYAESRGARRISLSRGMHDAKKRLGANEFVLLNHWIRLADAEGQRLVLNLKNKAEKTVLTAYRNLISLKDDPCA